MNSTGEGFASIFLPEGFETTQENSEGHFLYNFRSVDDVIDDIKKTVKTYYSIVEDNVDTLGYVPLGDGSNDTIPLRMSVQLYDESLRNILADKNSLISNKQVPSIVFLGSSQTS